MWIESVVAHAFGPFNGRSLVLAPGMTVVGGPNESGKSSWHAALYAGLCGLRRGKGKAPKEDEEFAARHRPWDQPGWEVSAVVALKDEQRVELRRDLRSGLARATDLALGRDCSAEIMHEGAPDGSVWLGLDRRSFLSVACVRQTALLSVREEPAGLQQYLQRAAATAGADATAAQALTIIKEFESEHVGQNRANSTKPLRRAHVAADRTRSELTKARDEYRLYGELADLVEDLQRTAEVKEQALRAIQARLALSEAEEAEAQLTRARELAARFPDGPPQAAAGDEALAQEVAAALGVWEKRPVVPRLGGQTAASLREQLGALPAPPEGDVEPAAAVRRAQERFKDAQKEAEFHGASRPAQPESVDAGGLTAGELADLGRDLAASLPVMEPGLASRLDAACQRVEAPPARALLFWVGAAVLAASGAAAALLGLPIPGIVLVLSGAALGAWGFVREHNERLQALEGLRRVEDEAGRERFALEAATRQRRAAEESLAARGLPVSPDALRLLARLMEEAARAAQELARWELKWQELSKARQGAEAELVAALAARGVDAGSGAQAALASYEESCRRRARTAAEAARRPGLQEQLEAVERLERAADEAGQERRQALGRLRAAAAEGGVEGESDEALAAGLRRWLQRRAAEGAAREAEVAEWGKLEGLLQGRTLAELEAQTAELRTRAERLGANVDPSAFAAVALEGDGAGHLARAQQEATAAATARDEARGKLEERARNLPSVAESEVAEAEASAELARVQEVGRILDLTREFLSRAQERAHRDIAPILGASLRQRLPETTVGRYVAATVDPKNLEVRVSGPEGRWRVAALLSHGTAEVVYLLLRVAMAERLVTTGEVCPLILDDVTAHCDSERKQAVLQTLHTISRERQVILFSHDREVLAWAESNLEEPRDRLVRLDPTLIGA